MEKLDYNLFPKTMFYNNYIDYDFLRIGGTIGHLKKTMPITMDIEELQKNSLEIELFDDMILLYYLAVSSSFKQASIQIQSQISLITQYEDICKKIQQEKVFLFNSLF